MGSTPTCGAQVKKNNMTHRIIEQCRQALQDAIEEDHAQNGVQSRNAVTKVETGDGYIELYVDRYGTQAAVIHGNESNNTHESTTFETAICAAAPEWWDADDEEESSVDDGFSSYNDLLDYMYR